MTNDGNSGAILRNYSDAPPPLRNPLLSLRKLPRRCHFAVAEVCGARQPRGEVLHAPDAATLDRARERWAALLQAHSGGRGCASAPAVTLETKG